MHRIRASAEDYANNAGIVLGKLVVGHNLAEGVELAHTAADKLRGLRTEIKNNYLLLHYFGCFIVCVCCFFSFAGPY